MKSRHSPSGWPIQARDGSWYPQEPVGVSTFSRGEIGALAWYAGDAPIADVYRALGEWISTHERPTCVDWAAA
jgi:hypothetical protein